MRHYSFPLRALALSLVLVLLTVRLGSYTAEVFVVPIQDFISETAFINEDTAGAQSKPHAFKPKRAFDFFFLEDSGLLTFLRPLEGRLFPPAPFQAVPEVYLDIFIPPDPRA